MIRLCIFALALFGSSTLAEPLHRGLRWDEVNDTRWETPNGRVFEVETNQDIIDLQDDLEPGDVMVMAAKEWVDARFTLTARGEAGVGDKIYLVPEIYGEVILTGKVQVDFEGEYIEVRGLWINGTSHDKITPVTFLEGSNRCRFTNNAITDFNRSNHTKRHHWIEIWGSYHTLDYVSLEGKSGDGQLVRVKTHNDDHLPPGADPYSWGHYIAYNYFGHRPDTLVDNGEGIQIGLKESEWVLTEILVEYNYFDKYDGEIECISVKGTNNTLRWNVFQESACTITLRHTDRTRVQENFFYCNGKFECGGVRIYGEQNVVINNYIQRTRVMGDCHRAGLVFYTGDVDDPYRRRANNNTIINNVCFECDIGICMGKNFSDSPLIPEDNHLYHNLFSGGRPEDYCLYEFNQRDTEWDTNNMWNCVVDNLEDYEPDEIVMKDPQWAYDDEKQIYYPTDADFEFTMPHPPIKKEDTGVTWM